MPKQNITIGNVKMNKSSMNLAQSLSEVGQNVEIHTKADFSKQLERIVSALGEAKSRDSQIVEALADLAEALREAKQNNPAPSKIRRFLNNAAALLNEVKDVIAPAAVAATGLRSLLDVISQIFK